MNILNDIPELVRQEIITPETADRLRHYYQRKEATSPIRLITVFSVLGAILTGLGIILIIAHNWDALSRTAQTFLAFLPLLLGQALCGYALWKKEADNTWRESAAVFLFFAMGASISLVSQVYHIPGDLGSFLLTWMALCLPLVYVMRSSATSLLFLAGITWYAAQESYWTYPSGNSYAYWLLLFSVLPYYFRLIKKQPQSNYTTFHHWLVPLSLTITLGTVAERHEELLFPAYMGLFGLFCLLGDLPYFNDQKTRNNGYLVLGSLGTVALLLALSFADIWQGIRSEDWTGSHVMVSPEAITATLITLAACALLYRQLKREALQAASPLAFSFVFFIAIFLYGLFNPAAVVLTNLLVLGIGITTIRSGTRQDHLGIINFGLLVIATLVACRFFDTDLSFVVRGVLFVLVGVGFFAMNYWILQKRKTHEH
ncbi:MAG TPA: DUF2157 domain-containing protein [Chitinophagaceae bacterium]